MNPNENIIELDALQTGDILLCVGEGDLASRVTAVTGSKYTHAAICYSSTEVVDIGEQVQKSSAEQFIKQFKYVAVFRNPFIWNDQRKAVLCGFLEAKESSETAYDLKAALSLDRRATDHQMTLFAKLTEHFTNGLSAVAHDKVKYICSEFVIAALIAVGSWSEATAIAYQGDTLHPGKMGHDSTFGFRVGYLRADSATVIPADDEFFCSMTNRMTFAEWQATQKQMAGEAHLRTGEVLSPEEIHALTEGGRFFQTEPLSTEREKQDAQ